MALWEIDVLLRNSVELIQKSTIEKNDKKQLIWNLENLPNHYCFDAGGFEKIETDTAFLYQKISAFQLGTCIVKVAEEQNNKMLIYSWSAFLLNWFNYFEELENPRKELQKIKDVYTQYNYQDLIPIHRSLTLYPNGYEYFSEEQNNLMRWFCNHNERIIPKK